MKSYPLSFWKRTGTELLPLTSGDTIVVNGAGSILGGAEHDNTAVSGYTKFGSYQVIPTRYANIALGPNVSFRKARLTDEGGGLFTGHYNNDGDSIGRIRFMPWNGSGFTETASIYGVATQQHSLTNLGTELQFFATPDDSDTAVKRLTITGSNVEVTGTFSTTGIATLGNNSLVSGADPAGVEFSITNLSGGTATTSFHQSRLDAGGNLTITPTGGTFIVGDLTVDTDTLFVDSVNNRVGIGTTVPFAKMHSKTSNTAGEQIALILQHGGLAVGDNVALEFRPASLQNFAKIVAIAPGGSDVYLAFHTVDGGTQSEIMRIMEGNVGINTTSPDTRLQVVGDCKFGDDNTNYIGISATGDLVFVGTAGLVFGSMYNDNTATTVTIGTSGTFERIPSGFTVGQLNNATFANAREITVLKAGMYKIDWSISFNSDAGSNLDMEGAIGIDNAKHAQGSAHRKIGAGNDIGNIAGTAILDLAENKVVSLMMTNNTNTVNIIVTHASLSLIQIGGT